mmetsp:Transcript_4648/g.9823  ORF Transcript_4648/g.9823 Transcript_4648/m.9823 type:complete len:285 (-) Transcript_4648:428-1282(-)
MLGLLEEGAHTAALAQPLAPSQVAHVQLPPSYQPAVPVPQYEVQREDHVTPRTLRVRLRCLHAPSPLRQVHDVPDLLPAVRRHQDVPDRLVGVEAEVQLLARGTRIRGQEVADALVIDFEELHGDVDRGVAANAADAPPLDGGLGVEKLVHGPGDDAGVGVVSEHGVGFSASCLAVREDAHVEPVNDALHQRFRRLPQFLLTAARSERPVEIERPLLLSGRQSPPILVRFCNDQDILGRIIQGHGGRGGGGVPVQEAGEVEGTFVRDGGVSGRGRTGTDHTRSP